MAMDHDKNLLVHAEMLSLLEDLTADLFTRHPVQFLMHLDHVRQKAAQHGLTALHDLSCAMDSTLQPAAETGGGATIVHSYVDAMQAAISSGPLNAAMTEALMANVALRLGGQP